jgi:hypothetical protein
MRQLLGCTVNELAEYLESKFLPGMSWENRKLWHIDHIRPLASFDLTDPAQQRLAFHYANLQPLWARDNIRKGRRYGARDNAHYGGEIGSTSAVGEEERLKSRR